MHPNWSTWNLSVSNCLQPQHLLQLSTPPSTMADVLVTITAVVEVDLHTPESQVFSCSVLTLSSHLNCDWHRITGRLHRVSVHSAKRPTWEAWRTGQDKSGDTGRADDVWEESVKSLTAWTSPGAGSNAGVILGSVYSKSWWGGRRFSLRFDGSWNLIYLLALCRICLLISDARK